ncbi:MAG: hypothetical protein Q9169_004789 [Polycauliona sp. 2 TL-2023]
MNQASEGTFVSHQTVFTIGSIATGSANKSIDERNKEIDLEAVAKESFMEDKDDEEKEMLKPNEFILTEYLDTEDPDKIKWENETCLLLLVAEFRDELDSTQKPHMAPKDSIEFLTLRNLANSGDANRYVRIGVAKLQRRSGIVGWGKRGLWGVHSAYVEENGWTREHLVLV